MADQKTLQCVEAKYGYTSYSSTATSSSGILTGRHGSSGTPVYKAKLKFDGIPSGSTINSVKVYLYSNTSGKNQLIAPTTNSSFNESSRKRGFTSSSGWTEVIITDPIKEDPSAFTGSWYVVVTSSDAENTDVTWSYKDGEKPYVVVNYTYNASIPTVSPSSTEFGKSVTINTNRKKDSYTHTLTMTMGSNSVSVSGVGSSYNWTIPSAWSSSLGTATSGTITINCETFDGSTSIGSSSVTLTAAIPASELAPSVEASGYWDPVSKEQTWVSGQSRVQFYIKVKSTSQMKNYTLRVGSDTYLVSSSLNEATITSNILNVTGDIPISMTATNVIGYSVIINETITVNNSTGPSIPMFNVVRCNIDNTDNANGLYAKFSARAYLTNTYLEDQSLSCVAEYRTGSGAWSTFYTHEVDNGSYEINNQKVCYSNAGSPIQLDITNSYSFRFTVTDSSGAVSVAISDLSTRKVVFDVYKDGTGFAIGKVSEYANLFDVEPNATFQHDVTIKGNLTVQGSAPVDVVTPGTKVGDVVPAQIANKLSAERTISLGGILNGSTTFDGSDNVTISAGLNNVIFGTYYGGTGVRASNALEMFRGLGLDIRTGSLSWSNSTKDNTIDFNPEMKGTPIVLFSQTNGDAAVVKVKEVSNTKFRCAASVATCTFSYVAIYWGN